ncbi:MAG: hypothetical protein ACI865_003166 [Flavobacteriaceae bacterium]|jgi:hypothetical protein
MKTIIQLFLLALVFSACTKNNPDPAWLEINAWDLQANPSAINPTGELSSSISDAWVYVDNELIGVFEVPCRVPILKSGTFDVKIFPTVLDNGISATKKIYPFLEPYETTVTLVENETATVNPDTRYYASMKFWIEDFEDAGNTIQDDPTSATALFGVNDPTIMQATNGSKIGRVTLSTTDSTWIGYTQSATGLNLPRGEDVYLEIDYYSTNALVTGLLAISSTSAPVDNPNIQMNAQDAADIEWKKIYIELREIITASPNADYFEISFGALLDAGETSGQINIDNIKVVHF